MKYAKGLFLFLISFLLACSGSDSAGGKSLFKVSSNSLSFSAEAASQSLTVDSDKDFTATSSDLAWCSTEVLNYKVDNLKISVSKNETSKQRVAIVRLSNGIGNIDIAIQQAETKSVLAVKQNNVTLRFGKPEFSLDITSTAPIAFELPEWISEAKENTWQSGTKIYRFIATPLPNGLSYRDAVIKVKIKDESLNVPFVSVAISQKSIPKVIAHRGYWKTPTYPQNSLASLQQAIDLAIYGSELDVWITTDGIVVLNHDPTINGINIEKSSYADLKDVKLSNGESIPTLEQCIEIVKKQSNTKLIVEIKSHSTVANENRAVNAVMSLIEKGGVADLVDYISFSSNICEAIIKHNPSNRVAYLNGNAAPKSLKSTGYWGLDYSMSVLKNNTEWIKEAREIGLKTNVWTVNTTVDFEYFISMGVDYITTDYPQNLKILLESK